VDAVTTVQLAIRLTPRAARTKALGRGTDDAGRGFLKIAVAAPPVDGAANTALIQFLAQRWQVPRSALTIAAGATARLKRVSLTASPAVCAAALADPGN
jgi:uncharacterized protein